MAYSDFTTISKVRSAFNLTVDEKTVLFADVDAIAPSDYLTTTLTEYIPLATAINTEKARSELIQSWNIQHFVFTHHVFSPLQQKNNCLHTFSCATKMLR